MKGRHIRTVLKILNFGRMQDEKRVPFALPVHSLISGRFYFSLLWYTKLEGICQYLVIYILRFIYITQIND